MQSKINLDYNVEMIEIPCLCVMVSEFVGPYLDAVDGLKRVESCAAANRVNLGEQKLIMLMFDDPHQCPKEKCKTEIGFTFAEGDFDRLKHLENEGYKKKIVKGPFAKVVTKDTPAHDLGRIQEYLWKKFLPKNEIEPRTEPQDSCLQIIHKSPFTQDVIYNEVLVPVKSADSCKMKWD